MPDVSKHGPQPLGFRAVEVEEIQVGEWCPTPDGTGPAEQVHVLIRVKGLDGTLVLRLKTGAAVDAVVDALAEHRRGVFGRRPGRG